MVKGDDWDNISVPSELHGDIEDACAPGQSKWGFIQQLYTHYTNCEDGDT